MLAGFGNDDAGDTASDSKPSGHTHPARVASSGELVEQAICDRLVKNPLISEGMVIVLERLELNALGVRDVFKIDRCKIWEAGFRANTSEFGAGMGDCVVPVGGRIWKSLQNFMTHVLEFTRWHWGRPGERPPVETMRKA